MLGGQPAGDVADVVPAAQGGGSGIDEVAASVAGDDQAVFAEQGVPWRSVG